MSWDARLRGLDLRAGGRAARALLLHNASAKLVALISAIGLWFFVNAGERDAEMAVQVPVELHNRPPSVMLVSPRVDFIDLVVSGPRTALNRIDTEHLAVVLDLQGVRPGPTVFRIAGDMLPLPRGVTVVRMTPAEVTLSFATVLRRRVPVYVALNGRPPRGLRIAETRAAPESVEVVGPAAEVDKIRVAETEAIDLDGAEPGLLERDVPLEAPSEYVSFSAGLVHAQVRIAEPERTRTFANLPIEVRNGSERASVQPGRVRLTVRGPRSTIDALELRDGAVYIDAAGREPGAYRVAPELELPAGVALVRQEPETVELRVAREKRNADGG
ncbi:MAG: YbbR-like domain-containing protein [Candidatus Binatia bacterium]